MSLKCRLFLSFQIVLIFSAFLTCTIAYDDGNDKKSANIEGEVTQCNKGEKTLANDDNCWSEYIKEVGNEGKPFLQNHPSNLTKTSPSEGAPFKTVATSKTRGRLGNHLWAYMHLIFLEFTYGIDIIVEKEVKSSLTAFFKNFETLKTVDDVCGYNEFFTQFRDMIDGMIERRYEKLSGVDVTITRGPQSITIDPVEVVLEHGKINAELLADSEEFIQNFKVDYTKLPLGCPLKWETFREPHSLLSSSDWNRNRALMMYPGNQINLFNSVETNYTIENDELAQAKHFQRAFFDRMQLKDEYVESAQRILKFVTKTHIQRHNITKTKSSKPSKPSKSFIYIGIHSRRTDHLHYQQKHNMKELDVHYYLDSMHLYREQFKKQSKKKQLIFVFVSDDLQWGKDKLLYRVKERDLYFAGSGLPDLNDAIGQDFALLASCNHTIESHGSFSYFAGAFAGGFKIKPNNFAKYRDLRHKDNKFWNKLPFERAPIRLSAY